MLLTLGSNLKMEWRCPPVSDYSRRSKHFSVNLGSSHVFLPDQGGVRSVSSCGGQLPLHNAAVC